MIPMRRAPGRPADHHPEPLQLTWLWRPEGVRAIATNVSEGRNGVVVHQEGSLGEARHFLRPGDRTRIEAYADRLAVRHSPFIEVSGIDGTETASS